MTSKILRADGVTELASIQSVTYHESVNADTDLRPGCVASSYIEVTCFGQQTDAPTVGEALTYCQVVGETETLIGVFYAEPSIPTKNSYKFVAYDAVHKLDADFSSWLSAHQDDFPYTVKQLVEQACTISGVTLGTSSWDHSTMSVNAWYADGLTCRNILQYAAEIACKFARCHTNGQIYFDWYSAVSNQRIYPSSGTSGSETRYAYKQDGLNYENYDTSALARVAVHPVGEDEVAYYYPTNVTSGNTLNITNNALLYGASAENMTAIAQSIYTTMTAFGTYRPMSVEMFPNECPFRTGDIVPVTDAQGISFTTAIMEKTVTDSEVTLASTGREVYGDYALDTAKQLVQLASDIVRINKLKVGWAEIDEAVVGVLTSIGMNPDEVVVSANTVTEYYLSTSSSSATGGSWGTSIPTWSSGKYVWTRDKTTNGYADGTSSTTYSPSQNGVYDANLTTALSTAASASSAASTAQSTANGANAREQTIYISKASGTSSVSANTTWVTNATGNQNTWTTKRPVYSTSYPVLFVAQQRQTVAQMANSGTTCSCTTPVKDDGTTTINGGQITTGTIDASRVTVENINASNITTGALTVLDANNQVIFKADRTSKTVQMGSWYADKYYIYSSNNDPDITDLYLGLGRIIFKGQNGNAKRDVLIDATDLTFPGSSPETRVVASLFNVEEGDSPISGSFAIGHVIDSMEHYAFFVSSDFDGTNVTNDIYFYENSVSVSNPSAWRTAIGAVNKAGDTMTGSLALQNSGLVVKNTTMDTTATSQSTQQNDSIYHYDKNNRYAAYWQTSQTTAGSIITAFAARRYLNSANVDNYIRLAIANNGTATVGLSHSAAWRSALGLIYEKNDTMTITASMDITGHINANSTAVYLTVTTSKSMESISTVTVTTLNGWFAGSNGALNGSSANVNYANTTGYSIATSKLDNYHVRIAITKSSAFTNSVNNGAANYFGTLTLKFT